MGPDRLELSRAGEVLPLGGEWLPLADEQLRVVGAGLAYLVAALHLFHPQDGFPRFVTILATGDLSLFAIDPLPLVFVLVGVAIVAGVQLALLGSATRAVYVGGMVLTAGLFLGYFVWHLTGHGAFLTPAQQPAHTDLNPVVSIGLHVVANPVATLSKLAEAALFVVLFDLYRRDRDDAR